MATGIALHVYICVAFLFIIKRKNFNFVIYSLDDVEGDSDDEGSDEQTPDGQKQGDSDNGNTSDKAALLDDSEVEAKGKDVAAKKRRKKSSRRRSKALSDDDKATVNESAPSDDDERNKNDAQASASGDAVDSVEDVD